jgi:hypothetical protein
VTEWESIMPNETRSSPVSLFGAVKPTLEQAPLVISSDLLVMMLRMVGALRAVLLMSSIRGSSGSDEVKATVLDMERQIAALLKAVDELSERQCAS